MVTGPHLAASDSLILGTPFVKRFATRRNRTNLTASFASKRQNSGKEISVLIRTVFSETTRAGHLTDRRSRVRGQVGSTRACVGRPARTRTLVGPTHVCGDLVKIGLSRADHVPSTNLHEEHVFAKHCVRSAPLDEGMACAMPRHPSSKLRCETCDEFVTMFEMRSNGPIMTATSGREQ